MRGFILVLSITSIVAFESPIYRREEWNNRGENAAPQNDQFYEGFFQTRIDHFKPLNQNLTTFVSIFCCCLTTRYCFDFHFLCSDTM